MTSEPAGQRPDGAGIWVICGNACAGKTTTARLLARRLPLAAHVEGDEMQRLIVSGARWPVPSDSDPRTGRLTGAAGAQYALRVRNACLLAAAFADAGITAIVTDAIISEGFESLAEVPGGRLVNFVVLRPPVAVLRQRGLDRLPSVGLRADPSGMDPQGVVDLLLDRQAEAAWMIGGGPTTGH